MSESVLESEPSLEEEPVPWQRSPVQVRLAAASLLLALLTLAAFSVTLGTWLQARAETLRTSTAEATRRTSVAARDLEAELQRVHRATVAAATAPRPEDGLAGFLRDQPALAAAAVNRPGEPEVARLRSGAAPGSLGLQAGDLQPGWHEPYVPEALGRPVVALTVPLEGPGTLTVLVSTRHLRDILDGSQPGEGCVPYVMTRTGRFVTHPIRELMEGTDTIFDLARLYGLESVAEAGRQFLADPSGWRRDTLVPFQPPTFTFFQRLPATGWVVCLSWTETRLTGGGRAAGRWILQLALSGAAFLGLLAVWNAARSWRGDNHRVLWGASVALALAALAATVAVWALVLNGWLEVGEEPRRVTGPAVLRPVREEALRRARVQGQPEPVFLPTGILVQTLEFLSANNVRVTGLVWQRLDREKHAGVTPGVVFPEATSVSLKEAWRRPVHDGELVGWSFQVVLRQWFDYAEYPLDREDVWVRMWPADFDRDVILEPHLDSYQVLNPESLPGVDVGLVLSGWDLLETWFDYRYNLYTANLGTDRDTEVPELYFNVILQRDFLNAFVSSLIPLCVVAGLLFGLLTHVRQQEPEGVRTGFSVMGLLGSCSGLFFAVVLAHNSVRGQFSANQSILYLEWFYFLLYGAILAVAVVANLVVARRGGGFIAFEDCLLPRLLYWPVLLGAILAVTLLEFA